MFTNFTLDGTLYKTCAQTCSVAVGVNIDDDCCNQFVSLHKDGLVQKFRVHKGLASYNYVARWVASSCLASGSSELAQFNSEKFKGPVEVPPISPKTINGTDPGSEYVVIVETPYGVIARKGGVGMIGPRIRVVKHAAFSWDMSDMSFNEYGLKWSTIDKSHISMHGPSIQHTTLIIAKGTQTLLKFGKNL